VDEQKPNDISYVYSGYAPISVRIVQSIFERIGPNILSPAPLRAVMGAVNAVASPLSPAATPAAAKESPGPDFKKAEETLKILPGGPAFEVNQKTNEADLLLKS
jgi:hypothetical protein